MDTTSWDGETLVVANGTVGAANASQLTFHAPVPMQLVAMKSWWNRSFPVQNDDELTGSQTDLPSGCSPSPCDTGEVWDTSTWEYDPVNQVLTQTGGQFASTTPEYRRYTGHGFVLDVNGGSASADSFVCTEGTDGATVALQPFHLCGNYDFGFNDVNDSTYTRTTTGGSVILGGDDVSEGAPSSIAIFDGMTVQSWDGETLVIANGSYGQHRKYEMTFQVAATGILLYQYDFRDGLSDWSTSGGTWAVGLPSAGPSNCNGEPLGWCAGTNLAGNYAFSSSDSLIGADTVLPGSSFGRPLLRYHGWWNYASGDYGQVNISVWDRVGQAWGAWIPIGSQITGSSGGWIKTDIDLGAYAGERIRIGFQHEDDGAGGEADGWFIDDVEIWLVTPIDDQSVAEGSSLSFDITAADPSQTPDSFTPFGLPAFGTLTDNGDGTATFDFNPLEGDAGVYPISVATVEAGISVTRSFTLTVDNVNTAPTVQVFEQFFGQPETNFDYNENTPFSLPVVAADVDGDPLTLSLTGNRTWLTITDNGDGTGTVDFDPAQFDQHDAQSFVVADDGSLQGQATINLNNIISRPQLGAINLSIPVEAWTGQSIDVSWTAENSFGNVATGNWVDCIYLSDDAVVDAGDTQLGCAPRLSWLQSGLKSTYDNTLSVAIPAVPKGQYYIYVSVDDTDIVLEDGGAESNIDGPDPIDIESSTCADLAPANVTIPGGSVVSGQIVGVDWDVDNIGTGATNAPIWHADVYLSLDNDINTTGDNTLVIQNVPNPAGLNAGESYHQAQQFTVPESLLTNSYYVLVDADSQDQLAECDEGNNVGSSNPSILQVALQQVPDAIARDDQRVGIQHDPIRRRHDHGVLESRESGRQEHAEHVLDGPCDPAVGGYNGRSDRGPGARLARNTVQPESRTGRVHRTAEFAGPDSEGRRRADQPDGAARSAECERARADRRLDTDRCSASRAGRSCSRDRMSIRPCRPAGFFAGGPITRELDRQERGELRSEYDGAGLVGFAATVRRCGSADDR